MQRLLQLLLQLVLQPWLLPMSGEELRGSGRGLPVRSAWDVPGCKAQVLMLLSRPSRLAAHVPTYHPNPHLSTPAGCGAGAHHGAAAPPGLQEGRQRWRRRAGAQVSAKGSHCGGCLQMWAGDWLLAWWMRSSERQCVLRPHVLFASPPLHPAGPQAHLLPNSLRPAA